MAEIAGMDPQSLVILIVALVGLVPVLMYYQETPKWFVVAYGFLLVAAFTTNFENVLLPELLGFLEHSVGNLGAGVAFAVAAYVYRRDVIEADSDEEAVPEA